MQNRKHRFYYIFSDDKSPGIVSSLEVAGNGNILTFYVNNMNRKAFEAFEKGIRSIMKFHPDVVNSSSVPLLHNELHTPHFFDQPKHFSAHIHLEWTRNIAAQDLKEIMQAINTVAGKVRYSPPVFSASPEQVFAAFQEDTQKEKNHIHIRSNNKTCEKLAARYELNSSHFAIEQFLLAQQESFARNETSCPLPLTTHHTRQMDPLTAGFVLGGIGFAYLIKRGFLSCFSKRRSNSATSSKESAQNPAPARIIRT